MQWCTGKEAEKLDLYRTKTEPSPGGRSQERLERSQERRRDLKRRLLSGVPQPYLGLDHPAAAVSRVGLERLR